MDAVHEVAIDVAVAPVFANAVGAVGATVSSPTRIVMSPWTSAVVSARS